MDHQHASSTPRNSARLAFFGLLSPVLLVY
jgi:hypothetical protein